MTPAWAVLATATTLAGCGGSDKPATEPKAPASVSNQQRGILGTVDALQTASRSGDGKRICADIFTAKLVRSIETAAKRSCGAEVGDQLFSKKTEKHQSAPSKLSWREGAMGYNNSGA